MQKIGVWARVFMSIGSKGTVISELFSAVTIGLSFQTQIGEISFKGIRATSAYERQGEN